MQREEKQIDSSLEMLTSRLNELKNQILSLMYKVEHERETLNWSKVLDHLALTSAQYAAVCKLLNYEKIPPLRNLTVLPLHLNPEKNDSLLELTEGRVPAFTHDLVPDYLRTKPEPEIEVKMQQFIHKGNSLTPETAQKQVTMFNKVINHTLDIINKAREDWDSEIGSKSSIGQTSNVNDTYTLLATINVGKGLKQAVPQSVSSAPPGMMAPPGMRPPGPGGPPTPTGPLGPQGSPLNPNQPAVGIIGKTPAIKTNIKSATQMHTFR